MGKPDTTPDPRPVEETPPRVETALAGEDSSPPPSGNLPESQIGSIEEEKIGALINEFFDRRERGEPLTEEQFIAEHAEHAEELRHHFGGLGLLAALGSSGGEATKPAGQPPFRGSSAEGAAGRQSEVFPNVPGYDVLKQIGRGGMGVVYKALQRSTKRIVALKVLLEGPLASESARRRFEREVALAAHLRHHNIIPIYDSGVAEGRMYYAMEYVHGLPLTDYLRAERPTIRARLQLFTRICKAISHAHQRGIIHRDLKPSNIIVDGEGEPHLLDFGLAKASPLLDANTSVSAQIVGTPAYMSPEQTSGDSSAVDTRSDVYSVGVVLYEMLTGRMPYDTTAALGRVLDNVAHADPVPPGSLNPEVDSELAAILLKALEKSKERRYQSVDAFCGDVERYLAGEPISAKPASMVYLLRRAINRHRVVVGAAAALLLFVALTWGLVWHYSAKVQHTQQEVKHLQDKVTQQQTEVEKHRQDAAALARQRDEAEAARQQLEWLIRRADPEVAKILGPLARELGQSANRGETAGTTILRLLAAGVGELGSPAGQPLGKSPDFDPTKPLVSPRPAEQSTAAETPPARKGETLPPEVAKAAETLLEFLKRPSASPATSQPAGSAPATSGPAVFSNRGVDDAGRAVIAQ